MTGKLGDDENLHRKIQGSQEEMDKLKLLDEFINKKAIKNRPHSENPVIEEQLPPPPPMYNQEVELSEIEFSDEQMVIDITNNDNEPQTSIPVVSSSSIQSTTSQPSRNSH